MVPEQFKDMPEGDLADKLRAQMDGLSRKRINHVLQVCCKDTVLSSKFLEAIKIAEIRYFF